MSRTTHGTYMWAFCSSEIFQQGCVVVSIRLDATAGGCHADVRLEAWRMTTDVLVTGLGMKKHLRKKWSESDFHSQERLLMHYFVRALRNIQRSH